MAWRIGVESGASFTDVCLFDDATGRFGVCKLPSTPDEPARGIARCIEAAIERTGDGADDATPRLPLRLLPAGAPAGVLAAQAMAGLAGLDGALLTFDMGGASTHVAVLPGGATGGPAAASALWRRAATRSRRCSPAGR